MKIAVFGAGGMLGSRIASEAVTRGHQVTVVTRDAAQHNQASAGGSAVAGDVLDPVSVATAVRGQDIVISAVGPSHEGGDPQMLVAAARALIAGLPTAGVRRLVAVGGAGSLEVAPGVRLMDTPAFPTAWKPVALAHRDALAIYRAAPPALEWTYVSPAAIIAPGERTGHYRTGGDRLVTDEQGNSHISAEDFAVAILDEVERPRHPRQRFTVAY